VKIAVLGATGRIGRLVVAELLRRGHDVTVLVRDPSKLGELAGRVRVVQGDARDRRALTELVAGAGAVMSTLGPVGKDPTLHREVAPVLVDAMREAGVRRFVAVSGAGIDVPGDRKRRRDQLMSKLIQRFGGEAVKDKPLEYQTWAASDLDWTFVRAPVLRDGPRTARVEHHAHENPRRMTLRRADLAGFLVDVVEQGSYSRLAPFVANA
jgi:putative NADH-flavin reductase